MTTTIVPLTFEEMKALYPGEWVLIGNPIMKNPLLQAALSRNLKHGIVLLHGKDRFEIAYKAKIARQGYDRVTLAYLGDIPKNRKLWL
jgi:hypothetical protein